MHYGDLIRSERLSVLEQLSRSGVTEQTTAFERLLVTANGNLQRIVSSWFQRPVIVKVLRNSKHASKSEWSRTVCLVCGGCGFCTADSTVILSQRELVEAVETSKIGLGQLFRHFNLLPTFELISARKTDSYLTRKYTLAAAGIFCNIEETFNLEELSRIANVVPEPIRRVVPERHAGADLMSGLETLVPFEGCEIPQCTPFERVVLTANGNIQRLTSSYLKCEVEVCVLESSGSDKLYQRKVLFRTLESKRVFGQANSTIRLLDEKLAQSLQDGRIDLGAIFSGFHEDSLPVFKLVNVQRVSNDTELRGFEQEFSFCPVEKHSLVRLYSLCTQYASLRIKEVFLPWLFAST